METTHVAESKETIAILQAPTPKSEAKTRKGPKGLSLTYVDARFVMDRFDAAFGPLGWADSYVVLPDNSVVGTITVNGVSKSDVGVPSDIEPTKGAFSDAFKRAAVKWGVGRDLYDEDSEVRSTNTPRSTKSGTAAEVEQAERAVVGQKGLTDKQRGKLFAALAEAGMTGDKRKAFVFLAVQKHSVKDMTSEDLDSVLAIIKAPQSEHPEVWTNVEMVSGD